MWIQILSNIISELKNFWGKAELRYSGMLKGKIRQTNLKIAMEVS